MSQTSAGYPLDNGDNADLPRCPMEALADRFLDVTCPKWLKPAAWREPTGECYFRVAGVIGKPEQLDDLINFLQEVRG